MKKLSNPLVTDSKAFLDFLIAAKSATYASRSPTFVKPALPGSIQLEHRVGRFLYRDIYLGSSFFTGVEIVYESDQVLWSMSYAGGLQKTDRIAISTKDVYNFLREAMRRMNPEFPARGPKTFDRDSFEYRNDSIGDIGCFHGTEQIVRDEISVYQLNYAGGYIKK